MSTGYTLTPDHPAEASTVLTYWHGSKLVFETSSEGEPRVLRHLLKAMCGLDLADLHYPYRFENFSFV